MEFVLHALAACRAGVAEVAVMPTSLPGALFLAGLAGSAMHCSGMCGPFVLGQVMADAEGLGRGSTYGEWRRLTGAALAPYHAGRLVTYSALGGIAGTATSVFAATDAFGRLAAGALGLAFGASAPQAGLVQRLAAPLVVSRRPTLRFALGLVLGFLPCGLIYGALGAATRAAQSSPCLRSPAAALMC